MSTRTFVVEAGHIMMFERGLGAAASYRADALAPLTFTQAAAHHDPHSPLRPRPGTAWKGSGRAVSGVPTDPGAGEGRLHAEQHFEYRRHVRAGETLSMATLPGRSWTKQGSSATLEFDEEITEFRDQGGEVVVLSRIVRVRRR